MNSSFFGELLQTISERGRALLDRARDRRGEASARSESLVELCEDLLSGRGEASGVALAREILGRYDELTTGPRIAFFEALAERFGPDPARMEAAIAAWQEKPGDETAAEVHAASEPRRQELFRRLNLAPGGTVALVHMREQLHGRARPPRRSDRGGRRFRASVLVLVQSRLPGAAPASTGRRRRSCWRRSSATRRCTRSAIGTTCAGASIRPTGTATRSSIPRWWTTR